MTNKRGEETRQLIKKSACSLFAGKGFKQVTMKDICEAANLSCILRSLADSDAFQSGRCAAHNGRPETLAIIN